MNKQMSWIFRHTSIPSMIIFHQNDFETLKLRHLICFKIKVFFMKIVFEKSANKSNSVLSAKSYNSQRIYS